MLLIQHQRAGTQSLKKFLKSSLDQLTTKTDLLKTRLEIPQSLSAKAQARYYSSWHYSVIHMALTIPQLNTRENLLKHFNLSMERLDEILQFLIQEKIISKEKNTFKVEIPFLHLEKHSDLVSKHHLNWRVRALQSFEEIKSTDLHYSLAFTISEKDWPHLIEHLMKSLGGCAEIIKPSKEETIAALCLDLFKL
ncbi:MAG: DUF4423 domain-containing protein [Oligoflexia bacterium]|nr:DUF4423 domain-containing protein [Oligoflexia bacterium]